MSNLKLSRFNYNLPENLIAQKPTKPRDHCRLLILSRKTGEIRHKKFFEIEKFLQKGDVLVLNDSKVIPARIFGKKILMQKFPTSNALNNIHYQLLDDRPITDNVEKYDNDAYDNNVQNIIGGEVEILLIKKISGNTWEAMLKNFKEKELGKRIIISSSSPVSNTRASSPASRRIKFLQGSRPESNLDSRLRGNDSDSFFATPAKNIGEGLWQIKFNLKGAKLDKAIRKYGRAPLPPYIKSSTKLVDYQTIYAQKEGSVAAPTAGLHFTKRLINKLKKRGIIFEKITLHIGLGTFAPIREENIEKHKIHSEYAEIPAKTARIINKARKEGRRVIAVGTTSARTLEAFSEESRIKNQESRKILISGAKDVNIFIKPGYDFKIVNGMITNFHLPKTTLMILVSAFAGRGKILRAYNEAINKKYRFFSFGDAMLII